MNRFIALQQRQDVLQAVVIRSRKRYLSRQRFYGELLLYRDYCAQFYPNPGLA